MQNQAFCSQLTSICLIVVKIRGPVEPMLVACNEGQYFTHLKDEREHMWEHLIAGAHVRLKISTPSSTLGI